MQTGTTSPSTFRRAIRRAIFICPRRNERRGFATQLNHRGTETQRREDRKVKGAILLAYPAFLCAFVSLWFKALQSRAARLAACLSHALYPANHLSAISKIIK